MEKNRLISMIDFVLSQAVKVTELKDVELMQASLVSMAEMFKYATFLSQPLNLGMLVPAIEVKGKWVVLEDKTCEQLSKIEHNEVMRLAKQYRQAKDRVLFEGFELGNTTTQSYAVYNDDSRLIFSKDSNLCLDEKTINDLIKYAPTLTAKGQELSGLNE